MNDIIIKDNVLYLSNLKELCDNFLKIPWNISEILNDKLSSAICEMECESLDNCQMTHVLFNDIPLKVTPTYDLIQPILQHLIENHGLRTLVRVKSNMNLKTSKIVKHGLHIDLVGAVDFDNPTTSIPKYFDGARTAIFYLNSNDGYTEFEDGTRIESVANRIVSFPYYMKHTGTTCTDQPFRSVINFNYF